MADAIKTASSNLESAIKQAVDKRRRGQPPLAPDAKPPWNNVTGEDTDYHPELNRLLDGMVDGPRPDDEDVDDDLFSLLVDFVGSAAEAGRETKHFNPRDPAGNPIPNARKVIDEALASALESAEELIKNYYGKYYWSDIEEGLEDLNYALSVRDKGDDE